jgi:hypothetical protein
MSELKPIWEDFFTGRKPSKAQVLARVKTGIKAGAEAISLQWGENWIELDFHRGQWHGSGHIREISAWDIAIDLNQAARDHRRTLDLWNS